MALSETELDDLVVYLNASPGAVDYGMETGPRPVLEFLPENLRRTLLEAATAHRLWILGLREHRLSVEQVRELARILREILLGDTSAGRLAVTLEQRLRVPSEKAQLLSARVAKEFITPNYFQIAQVYEKKHGRQAAGPEAVKPPVPPPPAPAVSQPGPPPRVVDLRNGAIPSRLPPPPAIAPPGGATAGKPPESPPLPPSTPSVPPPPPREVLNGAKWGPPPPAKPSLPPGPSADDLLDNLGKRPAPAPAPFERPPGGGTHGPLPTTPG